MPYDISSYVSQDSLTTGNYDTLVSFISNEITSQLEKAVFKTTFNRVRVAQILLTAQIPLIAHLPICCSGTRYNCDVRSAVVIGLKARFMCVSAGRFAI